MSRKVWWLVGIVVGLGLMGLLYVGPLLYLEQKSGFNELTLKQRIDAEDQTRRTLAQIIAGLFLFVGAGLTWRRVVATERTVEVAQEGQLTDRYTKAVELLADKDKPEARLGGIYALERTARDSKRDHWTVMEVLTAFVRTNAGWKEAEEDADQDIEELPSRRADIQAALTVLSYRVIKHEEGENRRLQLRHTDLRKADLRRAHFERAVLSEAHLEGANLRSAKLEKVHLRDAHLRKAFLFRADLEGAHLEGADLAGAESLTREQLESAHC